MDQYPYGNYIDNPPVFLPINWSQQTFTPVNTPAALHASNVPYIYRPNLYPQSVISTNPQFPMMPVFLRADPFYTNVSFPPPFIPHTPSHTDGGLAPSYGIQVTDPGSLFGVQPSYDSLLSYQRYEASGVPDSSVCLQQSSTQQSQAPPETLADLSDHRQENAIKVGGQSDESENITATPSTNVCEKVDQHRYQQHQIDLVTRKVTQLSIQPKLQQLQQQQGHFIKQSQQKHSQVTPARSSDSLQLQQLKSQVTPTQLSMQHQPLQLQQQQQQSHATPAHVSTQLQSLQLEKEHQCQVTAMLTQQPVQLHQHQQQQQQDQVMTQLSKEPQSHKAERPQGEVATIEALKHTLPLPNTVSPEEHTFIGEDQTVIQQEHSVIRPEPTVTPQEQTLKTTKLEPETHLQKQNGVQENVNIEQAKQNHYKKQQERRIETHQQNNFRQSHVNYQQWQLHQDPRKLRQEQAKKGQQYTTHRQHYTQDTRNSQQKPGGQNHRQHSGDDNTLSRPLAAWTYRMSSDFHKPIYTPQQNTHGDFVSVSKNQTGTQFEGPVGKVQNNQWDNKETQRRLDTSNREVSNLKKEGSKIYRNSQFNRSSWNNRRMQ